MENNFRIENGIKKEKGANVKIRAIFTRHGEKGFSKTDPNLSLTEMGKIESAEFGKKLEKKQAMKHYSSKCDSDRTKETVDFIVANSPTEKKMNYQESSELNFVYNKDGNFIKDVITMRNEILGKDFDEQDDEEKEKRLYEYDIKITNFYLNFEDERPDSDTYSPKETAATMARRVDLYIRMADKLNSGSDIDLVNGTHDLNIAAFLKEVIGFKSIEEIGGPINFNEGFEILIETDESEKKKVALKFRNKEYEIDEQKLSELVGIAKELEKNKYD